MNAHRINTGSMPVINRQNADFFYIEERETAKLAPIIRDLVAERLPNYIGSNPSDIQVLTPVRQGPAGVEQLNKVLQATLNPAAKSDRKREYGPFYPSDRVMQLRNNYNRMVFNGDIGVVSEIDDESGIVCVNYPDREDNLPVMYEQDELDELELAYATSVHKSQGSEFPVVVFPLVWTMPALMTRNLLYTAITRARKLVVLVGDKRALQAYVRNDTSQQRYSELNRRLNE
jgi:exodeoxyribonuclease V alpha subunit